MFLYGSEVKSFLLPGDALHVHGDDAFVGEDHAIAHGFVGADHGLAVQQQGSDALGVFVVLLEFEEAFVVEVDHPWNIL